MVPRWYLGPALVVVLFLSGCVGLQPDQSPQTEPVEPAPDGPLVSGERFLKPVEWPLHIREPYEPDPETEKPGDNHDDPLLVTERRYTNYTWRSSPAASATYTNLHGTPTNPICICDAVFVLENNTTELDRPFVDIIDSSWLLIDNVTVYGSDIALANTFDVVVSRSRFIDGAGVVLFDTTSRVKITDSEFISQTGPTYLYDHPPVTDACWPRDNNCNFTGVFSAHASHDLTIEWSYFEAGNIGGFGQFHNTHLYHNTFYNQEFIQVGQGSPVVEWNRVHGAFNGDLRFSGPEYGRLENNSIYLNQRIDLRDDVIDQDAGVRFASCNVCVASNNDFIGYGPAADRNVFAEAVLGWAAGVSIANDNYWGTIHSPKIPANWWVRETGTATVQVDTWFLEPIHGIEHIRTPLDPDDHPHWVAEIREQNGI